MHFLPYTLVPLAAYAVYLPLQPRADACEDVADTMAVADDGPTSDGSAGIGAEFETTGFYFKNSDCSPADTNAAKGQVISGRTGTNFKLTADNGFGQGELSAEYILDGTNIKIGSGDAARAGAAAAKDLVSDAAFRWLAPF